jgi:hypothetical protein
MKKCPKCEESKPLNDFAKNASKADGLQRICRICVKEQDAALYKKKKSGIIARNKRYSDKTGKWFIEYKQTLICEICGEDRYWVLEFHHTNPSQKDFNLGDVKGHGYSIERVKQELNKCICVCASCHRNIHYQQRINFLILIRDS